MKYVKAFGKFWWEFFIGDTPELFIGMLALLLIGWLASSTAAGFAILPISATLVLGLSILKATRTS